MVLFAGPLLVGAHGVAVVGQRRPVVRVVSLVLPEALPGTVSISQRPPRSSSGRARNARWERSSGLRFLNFTLRSSMALAQPP